MASNNRDRIAEAKRRFAIQESKELRSHIRQYETSYTRLEIITLTGVLALYGILFGKLVNVALVPSLLLKVTPIFVLFSAIRAWGYYYRIEQIGAYIAAIEIFLYQPAKSASPQIGSLGWENYLRRYLSKYQRAFFVANAAYWLALLVTTLYVAVNADRITA